MFQIAPGGASVKRGEVYPVHDLHLFLFKFHALDQGCNDLAAGLPVGLIQARLHLRRERLQVVDHQPHFLLACLLIGLLFQLLLQLL